MWHEARKQERRIRGMLVDYRKRAERRRDFYEKIRADPTQFLQLHGRQCKIHLDPAVAAAADSPAAMMPWQGQTDNLIDRFDVRAHLDFIPPVNKVDDDEATYEERQLNYERYRIIAQNSFLSISEEKFLKQLHLEEQFGYTENEQKKKKTGGAAIGFNYDDGTAPVALPTPQGESSEEQSDSDLDVDLSINVSKMDSTQAHEMNRHGRNFGMSTNDFYSFLTNDMEEAENYRLAKEEEHEKALFSGRKSRRERRAHREKRLANRVLSPPSYAARVSPTYPTLCESKSPSKSPSPENTGKITYITSFGDEDEPSSSSKHQTYADKVKYGKPRKSGEGSNEHRIVYFDVNAGKGIDRSRKKRMRSDSSDSSPHRSKERRISHRYRRSRSRDRSRRYRSRRSSPSSPSSTSSSRSRSKSRRRNRSRSPRRPHADRAKFRPRRRSYSGSRSASRHRSRTRSRSARRSRSPSRDRKERSRSRSRDKPTTVFRVERRRSGSSSSSSSSSSSKSRTGSPPTKEKSRSRSKSSDRSVMDVSSKSRSPSAKKESPPKVLPRYYGRKRSDQSSSELSDAQDGEKNEAPDDLPVPQTSKGSGNSGTSTKTQTNFQKPVVNLSLQERLRRKRQALLNKQFKADKIAEQLKTEREKQEQQNREDELREMAIKLRRRQRERRHAYDSNSSSDSDSEGKTKSPISNPDKKSKSPSPKVRDDRDRKVRENKAKYHDTHKERRGSREKESRRSPKIRENERDKSYRKREESGEAQKDRGKDHGRSLVDY